MAQQSINIGTSANDGTGDPLRTAFDKINDNFSELYGSSAEANDLLEDTTPQLGGDLDVNGKRITSARSNEDIILLPNGTGGVLASAVRIAGTTLSSDDSSSITIAEAFQVNGATNIDGAVTATSTVAVTGATTLSSTLAVSGATTLTTTNIDNINIFDNSITSDSNADINITPGGTGNLVLGALTLNGTAISASDSTLIQLNEAVNVSGATSLASTLAVTGATTLSSTLAVTGAATFSGTAVIDNITINDETISTSSNSDLVLSPGGTGDVVISALRVNGTTLDSSDSSAVQINEATEIDGTLTVTGTATTAAINATGNVTVSGDISTGTLSIGDLNITADGTITTDTNGDFVVDPAGTGAIVLTGNITHTGTQTTTGQLNVDNLRMDGGVISSTSGSITLTPASGQNVVVSAGALLTAQEVQANFGEFTNLRSDTIRSDTSNGSLSIQSQGTGTVQIGQTEFSSSASTITGMVTNGDMSITPNGTGDLKIDAHVNLVVQSGDAAADTNSAHIYAKDDSGSAEVFVRDEAGNVTKISPHNDAGEWEYYSKNVKTGKVVRVNMEKMIRKIEEFTGETFIEQ
jgi:fibronectin-binding autotransporter adhesin